MATQKILLTGASGLLGTQLSLALLSRGWKLVVLGRQSETKFREQFTLPCEYFEWKDPVQTAPPCEALNVSAVVNLMGEPIAGARWNALQKTKIRDSRVESTRQLVKGLQAFNPKLETFISCSAIGYYGDTGNKSCDEKTSAADDFLGHVCNHWEEQARLAPGRKVQIRVGVVLSTLGGALSKMLPAFENGLGGKLGNGHQWMSWIHITDLIRVFIESLENKNFQGPINAVSPNPVTNSEFTKLLASQLGVSRFFPVPTFALKLGLGEMSELLLGSCRIEPGVLSSHGFEFKYSHLESALKELFAWKESAHDRIFETYQWVPKIKDRVFPFFSDEKNLEILTPEFLNFKVLNKSTPEMQEGTEITYRLKIHGLPAHWRSRILDWKAGSLFRDIQLKGPYKKWDHTHGFEELAGGTLLTDRVVYRLPLASWGGKLATPLVLSDINKIFNFRRKKIHELFGA